MNNLSPEELAKCREAFERELAKRNASFDLIMRHNPTLWDFFLAAWQAAQQADKPQQREGKAVDHIGEINEMVAKPDTAAVERIGMVPCPCGSRGCRDWHLTGIGKFVRGSGFSKEEAELIIAALAQSDTVEQPTLDDWADRKDEYTPAIDAARRSKDFDHKTYAKAFQMVGNRHSKFALVHLVYWLLKKAEAQAAQPESLRMVDAVTQKSDA